VIASLKQLHVAVHPYTEDIMTISWNEGLVALLRLLADNSARQRTEIESRLNLNAGEIRELRRQQVEQEVARENIRTSTALQRPFNGLF
jgi:hypothetical protein